MEQQGEIKNILVTGGCGFIGSHCVVQIIEQTKASVVIVDDMSNCFGDVLERIKVILSAKLSREELDKRIRFHQGNILDYPFLEGVFQSYVQKNEPIEAIMHFAGKKSIGESFKRPMDYYENNVFGSMNLFKIMKQFKECNKFIFSSTASFYGNNTDCRQTDRMMLPASPYGESKASVQMLMNNLTKLHTEWRCIALRYFNPAGAHSSGLIGDEPSIYPNNLFPFMQEVVAGKKQKLFIFGNDYQTPDGTCIRDYVHISDLARGHVMAMSKIVGTDKGYDVINLGSGCGNSVLQVVKGFEKAIGKPLNYDFAGRRQGDLAKKIANNSKAKEELGWVPTKTIEDSCKDSYNFIVKRFGLQRNDS